MNEVEKFEERVKGKEFQAVILFADIMNASEISNNVTIEEYADIINQFHGCLHHDKAIEDYAKAIKTDPREISAINNTGYVYFDLNKFQDAERHFLKAIEIDNEHADTFVGLAVTYYKLGEKKKAKENYKKAIEIEPKYAGKVDELIKENNVFYSENQLQAIKEVLKEMDI